jgi:LPXTG-motif cell wall-anchored protein
MTQGGSGGVGAVAAATTTTAAVSLPNTGSNWYLSLAIAVGAGLLVWGVLYARNR